MTDYKSTATAQAVQLFSRFEVARHRLRISLLIAHGISDAALLINATVARASPCFAGSRRRHHTP